MSFRHVLGALALLAVAGCATSQFQAPLSPRSAAKPQMAYVYGHFRIDGVSAIHAATNNYASLGLQFACGGGQHFTIGLTPDGDQVLEVPPGECALKSVSFNNGMSGRAMDERAYPGPALQRVVLEPGRLHYLGDFVGSYSLGNSPGAAMQWKLGALANRFGATSARIAAAHTDIGRLPKVDATGVAALAAAQLK